MLPVIVRNGNVERAIRVLKKKIQRDGVIKEQKERRFYVKPSEKRKKKKAEAMKRVQKNLQKRMQKEGF
ncbi:30S ribosomal protein S21 [Candidatus Hydrogenosomobacter endosymbioticus]|uniref:Small ribosomal subunit protein bS21 n=1 Tax=Candidatus Hydrogenosomobacter endosymbioticus TaxID=2558174 RepID=A0ABN6L3A0_9PROT|nr:30S ribosomal protein S21 [Candidatus Hydrogenosomobacter endosymbioticus]BDB96409.1 30S ribosomal protein S21 [Candidatus Hydrogenosomobacter endosymbioticus]